MLAFALMVFVGLSAVTASPVVGPKVIGGDNAAQGEFPFVVSLQNYGSHFCGGSLISDQWVLTAGHCVHEGEDIDVYYGNYRLKDAHPVLPNTVRVSKYIRHPNFTDDESNEKVLIRNDLALLKLEHPVNFSANVQPIKLPQQNQTVPVNHSATLVGWGYIDAQYELPDVLQKENLTIFDFPYCDSYNGALNFSNDQNICAGDSNNTKGQCDGDSGGPLFIDGVQWGIVSWSIKPCTLAPGVLTRTSVFVDWIYNVMASN